MEPLEYLKKIESHGYSCYIVGGYVRDTLMGRTTRDVDITTAAKPFEVARIFEIPLDETLGCIRIPDDKYDVEVTTFRKEYDYCKRHPKIEYTEDLCEDLKRRDFTINAICMDSRGSIIDPVGGLADIRSRTIRVIGNTEEKFRDDPVRMMRALRFSVLYDFCIERDAREFIENNKHLLKEISYNRRRSEIEKMLLSDKASEGFAVLNKFGLFDTLELYPVGIFHPCQSALGLWTQFEAPAYPFTKKEKSKIRAIKEVMALNRIDKHTVFYYGKEISEIAGEILGIDEDEITRTYDSLAIHKREDLAIDGEEIKRSISLEDARKIEQIKSDLIEEILKGNLINETKQLKDYVVKKWK